MTSTIPMPIPEITSVVHSWVPKRSTVNSDVKVGVLLKNKWGKNVLSLVDLQSPRPTDCSYLLVRIMMILSGRVVLQQ